MLFKADLTFKKDTLKNTKICFQYRLSLQGEHPAILSPFIKLPFFFKTFTFSFFLSGRLRQVFTVYLSTFQAHGNTGYLYYRNRTWLFYHLRDNDYFLLFIMYSLMSGKSGPHCKPLTTSITLIRVLVLVNTPFMYRALVTCSELLFVSKHPLVINRYEGSYS